MLRGLVPGTGCDSYSHLQSAVPFTLHGTCSTFNMSFGSNWEVKWNILVFQLGTWCIDYCWLHWAVESLMIEITMGINDWILLVRCLLFFSEGMHKSVICVACVYFSVVTDKSVASKLTVFIHTRVIQSHRVKRFSKESWITTLPSDCLLSQFSRPFILV